jgi:hypothetical protein
MAVELAKRLAVKSTTGGAERITEQMMKNLDLNPSTINQIKAVQAHKAQNIALPADVTELRKIGKLISGVNQKLLKSAATNYSKSVKGQNPDELYNSVATRYGLASNDSNSSLGPDEEQIGQYIVNHKTKAVRKAN